MRRVRATHAAAVVRTRHGRFGLRWTASTKVEPYNFVWVAADSSDRRGARIPATAPECFRVFRVFCEPLLPRSGNKKGGPEAAHFNQIFFFDSRVGALR